MDPWQQARQIQYLLRERLWDGVASGAEKVFRTVLVSPGQEEELVDERVGFPFIWINDAGAEFDPQDKEQLRLYDQSWELMVFHGNMNDGGGQALLLGANRSGGKTSSKGRGLMEVTRELLDTLASLGPADGMSLRLMAKSKARPLRIKRHGYLIQQAFAFNTRASNQLTYPTPTRVTFVDLGGGSFRLDCKPPPERYDAVRLVIRYDDVTGVPPTSPTGGTGGGFAGFTSTFIIFAGVTPGTVGVSIWSIYDDFGDPPSADDVFSGPISVTGTVT